MGLFKYMDMILMIFIPIKATRGVIRTVAHNRRATDIQEIMETKS